MPCENANKKESLFYFLCLGHRHGNVHSIKAQINSDLNCKIFLGEKFLEDFFCFGDILGSKEQCQVTFLILFAHKHSLCSSSISLCLLPLILDFAIRLRVQRVKG